MAANEFGLGWVATRRWDDERQLVVNLKAQNYGFPYRFMGFYIGSIRCTVHDITISSVMYPNRFHVQDM